MLVAGALVLPAASVAVTEAVHTPYTPVAVPVVPLNPNETTCWVRWSVAWPANVIGVDGSVPLTSMINCTAFGWHA